MKAEINKRIGMNIKRIRCRYFTSLADAADEVDVATSMWENWEIGDCLSLHRLDQLAELCDISIGEFLEPKNN